MSDVTVIDAPFSELAMMNADIEFICDDLTALEEQVKTLSEQVAILMAERAQAQVGIETIFKEFESGK